MNLNQLAMTLAFVASVQNPMNLAMAATAPNLGDLSPYQEKSPNCPNSLQSLVTKSSIFLPDRGGIQVDLKINLRTDGIYHLAFLNHFDQDGKPLSERDGQWTTLDKDTIQLGGDGRVHWDGMPEFEIGLDVSSDLMGMPGMGAYEGASVSLVEKCSNATAQGK